MEKYVATMFWVHYQKVQCLGTDRQMMVVNARTDKARNDIAKKFMGDKECTHLLFLDSDQVFPPDTVDQLLAHKKLVVGCLYFHRGWPYKPHMYRWVPESLTETGDPVARSIEDFEFGELVECDALGTGGMMIAREVFEQIPYPWFEYGGTEESEDITFCRKLTARGIKCYCDTACESGHLSEVLIGSDNWRLVKETRAGKLSEGTMQLLLSEKEARSGGGD